MILMRPFHMPQGTSRVRALAAGAATLVLLACAPRTAHAQAAARVVPDVPSTNVETRRQADSLALYRLSHPKVKPVRTEAGSRASLTAKHLGTIDTARYRATAVTPLPQKRAKGSAVP